jgi:hypothetical protein
MNLTLKQKLDLQRAAKIITESQYKKLLKEEKGYSDEQVSKIGNEYRAFQKLLNSINYDDFMEYAEMSQEFDTLDILDYLKKKTKQY